MVRQLKETGLPAYLVNPSAADPDAPYRVRVGPYASRATARKTAAALEERRGEKVWVTKEN
jgi:cell division septation protein DedD